MNPTPLVLLVVPWGLDQPGGVSQVAANLVAQGRRDDRVEIAVFFRDYSYAVPVQSAIDGMRTVRGRLVAPWKAKRPFRSVLVLFLKFPFNVIRLARLLKRLDPAIINVHFPPLSTWSLLVATRLACPAARVVLSFHGADLNQCEERHPVTRFWWRRLVQSVDAVTCCSSALTSRFNAIFGGVALKQPPRAIHNGLDLERTRAELDQGTLPSELSALPPYILTVGTFEHKKGQDVLLKAFALLLRRDPALKLVLIGREGPFLPELWRLITELRLEGSVVLLQNVRHSDALAAFARARLFVLSSRIEPFGIVLLEAGYFGVPTVASAVGGVPEIVIPSESGLLVPPDDPEALATAMASLLDDEGFGTRLAYEARKRVERMFTWRAAFVEYLAAGGLASPPIDGTGSRG